jgi:hypothetical protein
MATARRLDPSGSGLRYDATARRYVGPNGRYVSGAQVRAATEAAVTASREAMRRDTLALQRGQISLPDWQLRMEGHVKRATIASAAIGRGGFQQLSQADLGWIGARVREQYRYLAAFARDIERGRYGQVGALTDGVLARADLYGEASRAAQREMERRVARLSGATAERLVLGPADHSPDCLRDAGRGWLPVGTLAPLGSRDCKSRCHCWIISRREAA